MPEVIHNYSLGGGTSCSISPDWGCNVFSWVVDGQELMYCPRDYPQTAFKLTGGGNPILFPSVGRTWDQSGSEPVQGVYRIHGDDNTYFMPSHGILFLCDFEKVDEHKTDDRLSVMYRMIVPDQVKKENFPFDLAFMQRFTLTAHRVDLEGAIMNIGDRPAPAAFGYHPYFAISNPQREGVEVRLPVKKRLMLTSDTVLLTGEQQDTDGTVELEPDIYYDHAFGEPVGPRMSLIDRRAGRTVHVDFDEKMELLFLYSPNGSDFVCIEPWTRGLGAYEKLREPGWESGEHIPVLQPGESRTYRAGFCVEFGE